MEGMIMFVTRLFVVVLTFTTVLSAEVLSLSDSSQSVVRNRREVQPRMVFGNPAMSKNLMRYIFSGKRDILNYLHSQIREEKRQRQCYWSVISCY